MLWNFGHQNVFTLLCPHAVVVQLVMKVACRLCAIRLPFCRWVPLSQHTSLVWCNAHHLFVLTHIACLSQCTSSVCRNTHHLSCHNMQHLSVTTHSTCLSQHTSLGKSSCHRVPPSEISLRVNGPPKNKNKNNKQFGKK